MVLSVDAECALQLQQEEINKMRRLPFGPKVECVLKTTLKPRAKVVIQEGEYSISQSDIEKYCTVLQITVNRSLYSVAVLDMVFRDMATNEYLTAICRAVCHFRKSTKNRAIALSFTS
mmetsp:Transcript_40230/g.78317  ORF Transcript_40230/g.78317 Transcript_40230/m.78317 type:complete len:118 (+) Transcript_40230:965-1318(+)